MALQIMAIVFVLLCFSPVNPLEATNDKQFEYFTLMKKSLQGDIFHDWNSKGESYYCNYTGITCDGRGQVTEVDIAGRSLTGSLPSNVCFYLPELRVFDVSNNNIIGTFPHTIINCSFLEVLNMSWLFLGGNLPDFARMQSLRVIDLSYNEFTGDFPISITNLSNLEVVYFNENGKFNYWELPENITQMAKLKSLILSTCNIRGPLLPSIGNMTSLVDLELSGNYLQGKIPPELGKLKNLRSLMLYYNELNGTIPEELGNLSELMDLDMSVNRLTGKIPDSISRLPKLYSLQLYNNSLTGEIPPSLGDSNTLSILSVYDNFLTGNVPENLGKLSSMILLDLSENRLSGKLPKYICNGGKLVYFLVLSNYFTGEIPKNYADCRSLLRFRVSDNKLVGSVPERLFGLPHVSIIDLAFNHLNGSIPSSIGNAKNMSEFIAGSNRFSGNLPPEISGARSLVKIDLSNNFLSGPIPYEIGNLNKLNLLLLRNNKLTSSIPNSLSKLKFLNVLDLSYNQLTGEIPESLSKLLPNSINITNNHLYGPIPLSFIKGGQVESFSGNPGLCVTTYVNSSDTSFPLCSQNSNHKKLNRMWVIIALVIIALIGAMLFLKRWLSREKSVIGHDESVPSVSSYDIKSFHKISFDHREILKSMVDKNVLDHGVSRTVYKIGLSNGEVVAVKKLWSQNMKEFVSKKETFTSKELETEVQTLGSIRHKNIVKLYCYLSSWDSNLLIYEYMPNGNLWDALHKEKMTLDWPTRHQIALGVAQGLAYLHHDLVPPIVHRDVKSSNILLDVDYHPKIADFGVAKVLQARDGESSNTVVAGTYGYLDPDYANTSKATTKCDVYSFGVVLMELVTGKKPVEPEFGENKNIINWVLAKTKTKEGAMEILDKRAIISSYKDIMIKVIRLAIRCTARAPTPRPTMNEVVQMLSETDPCKYHSSNSIKYLTKDTSKNNKIDITCQV